MAWGFRLVGDASSKVLELDIYERIGAGMFGGISADRVRKLLRDNRTATNINVRLHSKGGDVVEGFAMYEDLVEHPAHVEVTVTGLAASMASFIAMAGDEIRIAPAGFVMVHDPLAMPAGAMRSGELRDVADILDKMRDVIADVYARRTKQSKKKVLELMAAETWMTAAEAKANGFVDTVLPAKPAAPPAMAAVAFAALDLSDFGNVPAGLVAETPPESNPETPPPPAAEPTQEKPMKFTKELLAKLGLPENASEEQIIAAVERTHAAAAVSTDLATRVATLEATSQQSGIEAVITRLSTGPNAKLVPALHAWARTQTVAQLEAWAASAPPINLTPTPATTGGGASPGAAVTEPATTTITLTAADLEVCSQCGIDPKTFLEQRRLELERARLGVQAGA